MKYSVVACAALVAAAAAQPRHRLQHRHIHNACAAPNAVEQATKVIKHTKVVDVHIPGYAPIPVIPGEPVHLPTFSTKQPEQVISAPSQGAASKASSLENTILPTEVPAAQAHPGLIEKPASTLITPKQSTAVQNTPIQNTPAQNPPAQNPPAQNPPAQNPPAQNPPAQNPPAQNPPAQNPPAQNPPAQNPPAQNPPAQNLPPSGAGPGAPTEVKNPDTSAAPNSSGPTVEGRMTYYNGNDDLGSCGKPVNDKECVVALSVDYFKSKGVVANPNKHPLCNSKVMIHFEGKSLEATVVDKCPGCALNDIDATPFVFNSLVGGPERAKELGKVGITWSPM